MQTEQTLPLARFTGVVALAFRGGFRANTYHRPTGEVLRACAGTGFNSIVKSELLTQWNCPKTDRCI